MKKTVLTIAIIFGMALNTFAQSRGLFNLGPKSGYDTYSYNRDPLTGGDPAFALPSSHGDTNDQTAPIGSGALLLIGFGAAYALKKKNK